MRLWPPREDQSRGSTPHDPVGDRPYLPHGPDNTAIRS